MDFHLQLKSLCRAVVSLAIVTTTFLPSVRSPEQPSSLPPTTPEEPSCTNDETAGNVKSSHQRPRVQSRLHYGDIAVKTTHGNSPLPNTPAYPLIPAPSQHLSDALGILPRFSIHATPALQGSRA